MYYGATASLISTDFMFVVCSHTQSARRLISQLCNYYLARSPTAWPLQLHLDFPVQFGCTELAVLDSTQICVQGMRSSDPVKCDASAIWQGLTARWTFVHVDVMQCVLPPRTVAHSAVSVGLIIEADRYRLLY